MDELLKIFHYQQVGIYDDIKRAKVCMVEDVIDKDEIEEIWKSFYTRMNEQNKLSVFIKIYFTRDYGTKHKKNKLMMWAHVNPTSCRMAMMNILGGGDNKDEEEIFMGILGSRNNSTKYFDIEFKCINTETDVYE